MVFGLTKLYFLSNHKTGRSLYGKTNTQYAKKKTQVDRMIFYRVTAAANLKNVVLRKTRLKIRVLPSAKLGPTLAQHRQKFAEDRLPISCR